MTLSISIDVETTGFKDGLEAVGAQYEAAFATTMNMIASMIKDQTIADIQGAGNFGADFVSGLTVDVDGNTITTTLDAPGAAIFETGGTIHGDPLLWIGITGTDAEGVRASNYGDKLFSVNRKAGGPPLLFSVADKQPKYFGIESVNIPQKFHMGDIQKRVMENFQDVFRSELGE